MTYQSEIFQPAREHLLAYHDEREKVIRLCRDINSYSKKLIFTFHRVSDRKLSPVYRKQSLEYLAVLATALAEIHTKYWPSSNAPNFKPSISNSVEEMIEACTFMYFVMRGELLSYAQLVDFVSALVENRTEKEDLNQDDLKDCSNKDLKDFSNQDLKDSSNQGDKDFSNQDDLSSILDNFIAGKIDKPAVLVDFIYVGDFYMGLFDLTGEVMRYCISNIFLPSKKLNPVCLDYLQFMTKLYTQTQELFNQYPDHSVQRGVISVKYDAKSCGTIRKKMEVFKSSLEKVQTAICNGLIRNSEFTDSSEPERTRA